MASRDVNYWTLRSIFAAFINLAIVYSLLCGSAFAFICSKWLSFFGIHLPCLCSGVLGYQNYDLCWHKLLIDWPIRKIMAVEELIKSRFPFDRKFANEISEFEGGACSIPLSGPSTCESIDRESGSEAKGKKIVNQKTKSRIQRCKRASLGYAKVHPALSSNSSDSVALGVIHPFHSTDLTRTFSESLDSHNAKEDCFPGNDADRIRVLERALEEEKAERAMLYLELEKERAAAASAADEAMAMILRLQEDKAAIEMEARQYHREIEEKCNYDEEEMKILKEILVRREKEIHFLQKEVEAYEEMNFLENQKVEGDSRPSDSVDSNVNLESCNMSSSMVDSESTVYDVHVIDEKAALSDEDNGKENGPPGELNFSTGERLKMDNEVEWLRERLRVVQEEKERLAFNGEQSERVNAELKLVKDMVSRFRETHIMKKRLWLDSDF